MVDVGNHKLDRWGLVISGCIDGKSRLVCWLECDDNNRAETVGSHFLEATSRLGWPSRTRTDRGGENYKVCEYMLAVRGLDRGSHIAGPSTHNQRIERSWRDVWKDVNCLYSQLFTYLETIGMDVEDEIHMCCLHFVFLPRINDALRSFVERWNNHPITTERNATPRQIIMNHLIAHGECVMPAVLEPRVDICVDVLRWLTMCA